MDFDVIKKYRSNNYNKLLLLDYRGVLVNANNEDELPSERTTKVFKKLLQKPSLKIIVVNSDVKTFFDILSVECKALDKLTEELSMFESYDFVLAIGNCRERDGVLSVLPVNEKSIKISVGGSFENDNYSFENTDEVLTFLELLSI